MAKPTDKVINLLTGAVVGGSLLVMLGVVMALQLIPTSLHVASLWLGAILESVVTIILTSVLVGGLLAFAIRRWILLLPLLAFGGFLGAAIVSVVVSSDWSLMQETFSIKVFLLRIAEAVVGAGVLAYVWHKLHDNEI